MSGHYDSLEVRDPAASEREQFTRLPEAIACAMTAGCSPEEAAAFGDLVASLTVQQVGVTGTASPEQVRKRWAEVGGGK